jgi:hypothetical protein
LVVIAGSAAAALFLIKGIALIGSNLTEVVVPGEATLDLKERGHYLIFHEKDAVIDGRLYSSRSISGLRVTLKSERGDPVTLTSTGGSSTYHIGDRSGVSIFAFDIDKPGNYRLAASYDNGRTQPRTVLAVDSGFLRDLLATIFGTIAIAFLSVLCAVAIAVPVFVKRRRARMAAVVSPGMRPPKRQPTVS